MLHNVIAATVRGTIVSYDLSAPSLPVRQQKEAHASGINWICSRSDCKGMPESVFLVVVANGLLLKIA